MNKFFKLYLNGFKKSTATSNDSIPVDYSKMFTKSPNASFFTKLYIFLTKSHVNKVMSEFYQSDRYGELQRVRETIKKYES